MRLHFCILQVMEGVVGRPRNEASNAGRNLCATIYRFG